MPFIPTPNGIKVCLKFSKAGQQVCNVFHVLGPNDVTETILAEIASIFLNNWVTDLKPAVSSDTTLQSIEVTDISTFGGIGIEYTTGLPQSGTGSGASLPNNVTVATKLLTGHTGRNFRGRSYFNGMTTDLITSDKQHIVSGLVTALNTFFSDVISDLTAVDMALAVLSLVTGGVPRTAGVLTAVTNVLTNLTLDSQRRRLPERGA